MNVLLYYEELILKRIQTGYSRMKEYMYGHIQSTKIEPQSRGHKQSGQCNNQS